MGHNMVEILSFSRETAFTPETIEILATALDEAWERLKKSGSRLARPAYSRVMREVVAKRIMEMAQRGVQDRETLVEDALRFVAANYEEPCNSDQNKRGPLYASSSAAPKDVCMVGEYVSKRWAQRQSTRSAERTAMPPRFLAA
jgi:hypothetical protein